MSAFSRAAAAPLRAWSEDRLKRSCGRLDAAFATWASAWGLDMRCESTSCTSMAPCNQEMGKSFLLGRRGEAAAWLPGAGDLAHRIHLRMFGRAPSEGSIAEEVALSCQQDLLARLRGLIGLAEAEMHEDLPPGAARPWSGWVVARSPLECRLLLSPEAMEAILEESSDSRALLSPGHAAPLVPLAPALASCSFHIHVELDGCEVSIEVVEDLQPGDVLRLKHVLEAPALVRSADGTILFSGFMVRQGARRALELAPQMIGGEP